MKKTDKDLDLFIDIGNTNTAVGVISAGRVRERLFIHSSKKEIRQSSLRRLLNKHLTRIGRILVVSVVPDFHAVMTRNLSSILQDIPLYTVGSDIKVPLKIRYRYPSEVGQDRLVTSYAARELVGTPLVSVDFGTAVTFDYINDKGDYAGGLIFPGLRLGLKSLSENTALLPEVEIVSTRGLIGRDTSSSISKGILLGYAAMCDGIIHSFRTEYGKNVKVACTGGDAALVSKYSRNLSNFFPDLIFTGLSMLSKNRI